MHMDTDTDFFYLWFIYSVQDYIHVQWGHGAYGRKVITNWTKVYEEPGEWMTITWQGVVQTTIILKSSIQQETIQANNPICNFLVKCIESINIHLKI